MNYQQQGIQFAIENLKAGNPAGWQSGAAFDPVARGMGQDQFAARGQFEAGVQRVDGLSFRVKQAIRDRSHSQIDWLWSQGQIPTWLFPYVRDIGVLTRTIATTFEGDLIPGAEHCERGS